MSSPDHDDLAHLKIPLESILSATKNFSEKKLFREDTLFEKVYWGKLSWSDELISVVVRRLNKEWVDGDQQFWMEVSMLSSLKHKNLVSLVGFCDDNDENIIIYKPETKGRLYYYLGDPMLLTWVRRLEICVSIAQALSYIHYDESRDFSVIHCDIDSLSIQLNDDWEPKLGYLIRSMKIKATERHNSFDTDKVWSTDGYTDPTYIETKSANHKSDMYSFGIVMFELLCGRKAVINDDQDNKYLASVAVAHYREKKLDEIIDLDLRNQMDSQSFNVFAEIAYGCLNEERSEPLNIDEIVTGLEKALELQLEHHNAIISSLKDDLAHLKIPLENIISATENFSRENRISKWRILKECFTTEEYKGQLSWSDELIDISAWRFERGKEREFWMEVSLLSSLKHKNLVSLVGFCDENDEKIIITRRETRGSLEGYLGDPMILPWVRRLEISVGIAQALSYIHYDESRDFSVIHRIISCYTVQLNDDWEPKLSNFEYSMKIQASQRHHSFHTNTREYAKVYGDPTYIKTKSYNHKSDMYLFGIVLIELLCGKEIEYGNRLAPPFITHYQEKKLDSLINRDLRVQMDLHSFNMFAEIAYECLEEERSRRPNINDIVPRLEKALQLARENRWIHSSPNHLAHLRIPLEDLLSATKGSLSGCREENVGDKGRFGDIYEGQLSWCGELINITFRRLVDKEWDEKEQQFWTEISMLSSLKHKNLVSIVGFCNEVGAETIIYKQEVMGRLKNYLSKPMLLTWVKRLEISVGVAHALSYIHYDEPRDFSVIHRNISSEAVRLNNDWEPKLSEFQHAMKIKASERHHSFLTDSVWSMKGRTNPTCEKTNIVNHKSDIYSFGMLLFELLFGRESVIDDEDNKYLAPVAIFHYREKILDEIIDPDLLKQMDLQSLSIFAETAYECLSEEQSQRPNMDQIVTRLEKALELQLEWKKTEYSSVVAEVGETSSSHEKGSKSHFISPGVQSHLSKKTTSSYKVNFKEIERATKKFAPENILKKNLVESVYQGNIVVHFRPVMFGDIVARRINYMKDESEKFEMKMWMLLSLKHKNLVSVIGFCDERDEKIIIYKKEANGSLNKYLSDQTLTWTQRLKICLGVANALSYIHYDVARNFSVIHCNIRSSKVLLDDKWEPKLSGLELSLKNTVARRHCLLLTRDLIENVYLDPKYKKTGGVTHKSDVYSFGIVLFEVLCGRSAVDEDELGEGLLRQLAKSHWDDTIDPHLRKQMDPISFKIFSETAYYCIQEERANRPHIDQVVKRLEEALKHQQKRENPVDRTFHRSKGKKLEHLRIELNDINEATNNFNDAYCIGSGEFGKVYRADLEHFDSSNSSSIVEVDTCNLPRKRSMVAIKRIHSQEGEQGFISDIETLTTCKHENIISLLGFCYEGNGTMILVYEHASKGSLENYLGSSDKMTTLTWVQRLNICLDIAHGLNYIHNNTDHGKQKMIHSDIKSDNILLGDNWEAKIADFGLSKFRPANQAASTIYTNNIAGAPMYLDPEYQKDGKLNKKSDIYSFGVVLLEILTGTLAYDSVYTMVNEMGIAPIARDHFEKRTIMEIVDHNIKEETDEHVFCKGPDKDSLDIFLEIASRCVAETQEQRPTIEVVIEELKKALNCQENHKENLKLSLEDIKLVTQDFNKDNVIGHGDCAKVYRGATHTHGHNNIAAKRLDRKSDEGEAKFMTELEILMEYKHENVIGLVGYCDEEDEKIIVYEYASRGSLDKYLSDDSLTWVMRLKICIDIAIGLEFLHGTVSSQEIVIHRDIRSSNILLFDDWKAKISGFVLSFVCPVTNQNVEYVNDNVKGTIGYCDPLHRKTGFLTKESDIFSLGAVLFDILCGKLSSIKLDDGYHYLPFLAKHHYQVGKLDELVFEGIKEQIEPQSFITFARIAYQCIHHTRERRPTTNEVVVQLKKALELQLKPENYDNSIVEGASSFIHKKFQHLKIELQAIKSATNEFDDSHCIGKGGFGKVYKGELVHSKGQSVVALKRLDRAFGQGDPEFWKEIIMLSQYRHDNIVSLLGFCDDRGEKILVYDYASKRSLDLYLSDKDLMWVQRLKISIGAARGLAYLHNPGQTQQRVLHRDIKSSNILLDENWNARIADFGLSKFGPANQQYTFLVSNGVGTIGYCDPLYVETGLLTKESDVYSFGVVLFEILCGRLCIRNSHDMDKPFVALVRKCYEEKTIASIVYGHIKDKINPDSLKVFTAIAYQCLNRDQEQRPSMTEVVKALESALRYQVSNEPPTSSLSRKLRIS